MRKIFVHFCFVPPFLVFPFALPQNKKENFSRRPAGIQIIDRIFSVINDSSRDTYPPKTINFKI